MTEKKPKVNASILPNAYPAEKPPRIGIPNRKPDSVTDMGKPDLHSVLPRQKSSPNPNIVCCSEKCTIESSKWPGLGKRNRKGRELPGGLRFDLGVTG